MITTIRLDKNSKFEASYTTFEICHVLGLIGLRDNFTVRAPNCCCDDKHHRTRLKRSIRGVSEHFTK